MILKKPLEQLNGAAEKAMHAVEDGMHATQVAASEAVHDTSHRMRELASQVQPMMEHAGQEISDVAHQGVEAVRGASRYVQHAAAEASDRTVAYIRKEPIKSVLIAAAAGAVLASLARMLANSSRHRS